MLPERDHDRLTMLTYMLGIEKVSTLTNARDINEVRAWASRRQAPTSEQIARLRVAHAQFTRIHNGEGTVIALEWFTSADVIDKLRNDQFKEVEESATLHMMPNDD